MYADPRSPRAAPAAAPGPLHHTFRDDGVVSGPPFSPSFPLAGPPPCAPRAG